MVKSKTAAKSSGPLLENFKLTNLIDPSFLIPTQDQTPKNSFRT